MAVRAKLGAGVWDFLICQDCGRSWSAEDVNLEWTDEPEEGEVRCSSCSSTTVIREERG